MTFDVFVSYSSKDKAIANTIVASMEQNQIRCWYAPRDIKPSEDWANAISNAIEQSKVFLLIFSGNSNQSQRVLDELSLAISHEIPILPFRIENLEPDGAMRLHLSSRHWLDAYAPSWEDHLLKLIQTVSSTLETTIAAEDFELPAAVGRTQRSRRQVRVWRIAAGLIAAAAVILLGWYGMSRAFNFGSEPDNEIRALTEQAALTQAAHDGRCQIAFFSTRSGNPNLWLMDPDGSNTIQLTFNQYGDFAFDWSPDGSELVFVSERDGDMEIFIMNADGTNIRQLTSNETVDWFPKWSPLGDSIAFYSNVTGDHQMYVMDLEGNNVQQVTTDYGIFNDYEYVWPKVGWSPDGEQIAFISDRDGDREIYIMNSDGTNVRQLTFNEVLDQFPDWSPSGNQIVFESDRFGDIEIFVIDTDGSNLRQLTSNNGISQSPIWSPDGRIVFNSDRTGNFEIWTMDGDGSNQQQLTFNDQGGELGFDGFAIWSPLCK
jgi:TolB protein